MAAGEYDLDVLEDEETQPLPSQCGPAVPPALGAMAAELRV